MTASLIFPIGSQVVTCKPVESSVGQVVHQAGSVGVVIRSPSDRNHSYRVRFHDGSEFPIRHDNLSLLAQYQEDIVGNESSLLVRHGLFERVIFRCIIGSRAYGLDDENSDTDYRGIFLPTADTHWSLYGVPEQIENEATQETYWELQKFISLALKANPNVLECLYSPLIETATPLAQELLSLRSSFLSRLVYQTYNGYVLSQFKKVQTDLRNQGRIKWKHVMHLIRLLLSGITTLREGIVPVQVAEYRKILREIRSGQVAWGEIDAWRLQLHSEFDAALTATALPVRPDYERANAFLIRARRLALESSLP